MSTLRISRCSANQDTFGIPTVLVGTVRQDGKEYPIRTGIVEMTPELAKKFAAKEIPNQRNRKKMHLDCLRRDLLNGHFVFTGEPIIVTHSGSTADGMHRVTLSIETGKSFVCMVVFGVPDSSYRAMNQTAKKSGADVLKMSGRKNVVALAGAAAWLFKWQNNCLLTNVAVSTTETDEIVAKNPGLEESVTIGKSVSGIAGGGAFPSFFHFVTSQIDRDAADRFLAMLATDVNHSEGSPALALRRALLADATADRDEKLNKRQMIVIFFEAWNAYRLRRKVRGMMKADRDAAIPDLI